MQRMEEGLKRKWLTRKVGVIYLVIYTAVVGLILVSFMQTHEGRTKSTPQNMGDDVIVLPKSSVMRYMDSTGDDGKLLVKISFPRPGKPAQVLDHYKSMRGDGNTFKKKFKKCALVFSSGHLLGSNAGQEIDSMPCVIRMNAALTQGFEVDVGQKTTVRVVCHMSAEPVTVDADLILGDDNPGRPDDVLIFGLSQPNHAWAAERMQVLVESYPNVEFYSLDEVGEMESELIFEKETGKNKYETNTWLSTGWFAFLAALDLCEELHVYGMVDETWCEEHPDSPVRYHYYQSWDTPTECEYYQKHESKVYLGGHRFITEKAVFASWAKMFNVHFHYPYWDPKKRKTSQKRIETPFVSRDEENKSTGVKVFHWFLRNVIGFTT